MIYARILESFWLSAFWSAMLILLVGATFNFMGLDFDPLFWIVVGVGLWVFLMLIGRMLGARVRERMAIELLGRLDLQTSSAKRDRRGSGQNLDSMWASAVKTLENAGLCRMTLSRLAVPIAELPKDLHVQELEEEMENALHTWYIPVNALVWALPALGFLGTALHLRKALMDFAAKAMEDQTIGGDLLGSMVPHLAGSFTILCFALALTALSYVLVSVVQKIDLGSLPTLKQLIKSSRSAHLEVYEMSEFMGMAKEGKGSTP